MEHPRPSRREFLGGAGLLAGGLALGTAAPATARADTAAGGTPGELTVRQGTNISAAASPDGTRIAFDLYTVLWMLPVAGGTATRLTDDLGDATQPRWSPDGRTLAFQSYRDGNYHLWTIGADGAGLRKLTSGGFDSREPVFAPDGRSLVFASDRGGTGSYGIFRLECASGLITKLTDTPAEESQPAVAPDGSVLFTVDQKTIASVPAAGGEPRTLVTAPQGTMLLGPSPSPDGRRLAYVRLASALGGLATGSAELVVDDRVVSDAGEDVFGFAPTWLGPDELLYTADGEIRRRRVGAPRAVVAMTASVPVGPRPRYRQALRDIGGTGPRAAQGIASPAVSRDGKQVAFRALGAIHVLTVGDPRPRRLDPAGYFDSDPDFSPDGRTLVFASDRAGEADLWLHDLATGNRRRLTAGPGAQTAPRFSPDGTAVAYADQDGVVSVLDLRTGTARSVTPSLFQPGRCSWSADGRTLALAAVKPFSKRFREGTSQILTVDLAADRLTYLEPEPFGSLATRGDDGPLFSPDGTHLAFVVASTLRVVPVDPTGRFTGPVRTVTTEVTDSVAWVGNDRLLYLNNGRLRTVSVTGGSPSTVPLQLDWSPARVAEPTVLKLGALWDGRSRALRRDVDLVTSGGNIEAVLPTDPNRRGVDARELTAMPGLVDSHVHWHLRGRQWGDRQGRLWLSYGVTSVRSPGDPVYQFVETREAITAGTRVGPRLYGTGEAIDGGRVYYNFMRPTLDAVALERELERARRLEYDLIKTYVRLPVSTQGATVARAHAMGLPLSSHYLYPAQVLGMDGMEHTGATNRLGYSHTVSRLGRSYQDAVDMFVRSGMSITPTLFTSAALYATDRSLVDDRRTKVLYPPWELTELTEKADGAAGPGGEALAATLAANVDMVLRIHRAGGFVISGTDAPLDNPALSLHMNLRAMVAHGFSPYEALTTATVNPARRLGLAGRLGELIPGAAADVSFVRGDPLADITIAAAVDRVMVAGHLRTVDELVAPFEFPLGAGAPPDARVVPASSRDTDPDRFTVRFADGTAPDSRGAWWHVPEWSEHVCCSV